MATISRFSKTRLSRSPVSGPETSTIARRRPENVVIAPVVDLNLPQPLALAWRKDNKSPLLAGFVVDVRRLSDARAVNKG
jgi:hypothetical protein